MREPTELLDLITRVVAHWARTSAGANPGRSTEDLDSFELATGAPLPADLRVYFATVDGMAADASDDLMLRFVPLAECERLGPGGSPGSDHVVAEHRLGGFRYLVDQAGAVSLQDDGLRWPIAPSFADFLEIYLDEPGRMFPTSDPA